MTIVHVVESFAAGVAVFVRSLTENLSSDQHIIVHGERKYVMSANEVKKDFPLHNVRFIRWRSAQRSINPFRDILALTELCSILRRLKKKQMVDAVHLHSSKSGLLGRIACRITGISNILYTPNGAPFLSARNRFTRFFFKRVEIFGNRLGGKVICCSFSELQEYRKLGIDAEYVNNGINIVPKPAATNQLATGKFRIVTCGRIDSQKNPSLFKSIASYFKEFTDIEFIWIGDGPDKKFLTAGNIVVTGWLANHEVQQWVAGSDVYLSTSEYEGLSFAVLEAMALQKPVLLSNCTGNRDAVKKGINGSLFFTAEDAITKILSCYNNRAMLQVMGDYSKEIAQSEFDAKYNSDSYRDLYSGLAGIPAVGRRHWIFKN